LKGSEIRQRFLEHFTSRDHLELPSASLIPHRDPTTLFISAGMHPLKPYYLGVSEPPAPRLTTAQKCFRTGDLEEVGRTDRHNTFFEMLGNFAPTGSYFKEGAIPFAWSLVTEGLGMPKDRLRVTIHPTDDQAAELWRAETDVRPDWIYRNEENWWAAGETGPCGPDSELWWDRGPHVGCGQPDCYPDHCDRFLEFWNLVFMQYNRRRDGELDPLPRPGIDTGMGLERISSILQDVETIFDTDLFAPLMDFVASEAASPSRNSQRLISDHLRGMAFVIGDGVLPANEGRGYVLRRLIRRAALHARRVGLRRPLSAGVGVVVDVMGDRYPEVGERSAYIREVIDGETSRFNRTLEQGMEVFERMLARGGHSLGGEDAFLLHDTYGFPLELTRELAHERDVSVDEEGFQRAMAQQRERSRTMTGQRWPDATQLPKSEFLGYATTELTDARVVMVRRGGEQVDHAEEGDEVEIFLDRTPFYAESGGQVGDTGWIEGTGGRVRVDDTQKPADGVYAQIGVAELGGISAGETVLARVDGQRRRQVARHHTATHLLHRSLREVLGEQTVQRGSWVGPDHTTFDFPLNRAMTAEELEAVGKRISDRVRAALPFHESYKPYREAVESGAMHLFEEKYGDTVRVVCFGDWTCELCGGTHVGSTADVGTVLIVSESSIGSGLRRIDLVAGEAADELVRRRFGQLGELSRSLGVPAEQLPGRVHDLQEQVRQRDRELKRLQEQLMAARLRPAAQAGAGGSLLVTDEAEPGIDIKAMADLALGDRAEPGIAFYTSGERYVLKVSRELLDRFDALRLREHIGPGGGRPDFVQGKLDRPREEAVRHLREITK
jgi:alanyl-tRNA synthetase